ncbi:MAG: sigma-70 family RNA polymerase sigma factor [Proteobacteria bacterium]|nr:MAG: sigma-70 family RNA polymerase sigma factor [Pseudomonadota bacterium]
MAELSDEQLLDRYFCGEAAAFTQFFMRHRGRVFAYAKKKGLDNELAQDVSQEAFLRLHRSIDHYESGRPALAWFFSIVHSAVIDALRKLRNVEKVALAAGLHEDNESEPFIAKDPEEWLKELSEDQRLLMQLRAVEELSFKEISQITGKSDSNLRKLFERTRNKLKLIARGEQDS